MHSLCRDPVSSRPAPILNTHTQFSNRPRPPTRPRSVRQSHPRKYKLQTALSFFNVFAHVQSMQKQRLQVSNRPSNRPPRSYVRHARLCCGPLGEPQPSSATLAPCRLGTSHPMATNFPPFGPCHPWHTTAQQITTRRSSSVRPTFSFLAHWLELLVKPVRILILTHVLVLAPVLTLAQVHILVLVLAM